MFTEPNMKWMCKIVIPEVSYQWRTIADFLKFPIAKKKEIAEKHHSDPQKCCAELMEDWLTSDQGVSPKTWHTLVLVLKEIGQLSSTADSIEQSLISNGLLHKDSI